MYVVQNRKVSLLYELIFMIPWRTAPSFPLPKCRTHCRKCQVSQRKFCQCWTVLQPLWDSRLVLQSSCVSCVLSLGLHASWTASNDMEMVTIISASALLSNDTNITPKVTPWSHYITKFSSHLSKSPTTNLNTVLLLMSTFLVVYSCNGLHLKYCDNLCLLMHATCSDQPTSLFHKHK